jgi:hypothetical protein
MPVNKERVQLLIDALESGKYRQGYGALSRVDVEGNRHDCCLGVACYVANENGAGLVVETYNDHHFVIDGLDGLLSQKALKWYGFTSNNPVLKQRGHFTLNGRAAAVLNDRGVPFSEIADAFRYTYIEGHEPDQDDR